MFIHSLFMFLKTNALQCVAQVIGPRKKKVAQLSGPQMEDFDRVAQWPRQLGHGHK